MKASPRLLLILLALGVCLSARLGAFPPAPHHVIHGTVRDELGDPVNLTTAVVSLETTTGIAIKCNVTPGILPGENYRLTVPMDSFTKPDAYKTTALAPTVPFRMKVKIGNITYLPIELAGNFANLGAPAGDTLLNLTLGVDSDGDGLPDAWEALLIQMLGGGKTLADIKPNGDDDHDGISNYSEYIAGTYAFDPQDGLKLAFRRRAGQGPIVEFFGIADRTYILQGSTNLTNWTTMTFRTTPGNTGDPGIQQHVNLTSQMLQLEVLPADQPKSILFRVRVN